VAPLTVGFMGGVPQALGGGGLEVQMERTGAALEGLGHRVVRVECADANARLDVLHAFHAEPLVWQLDPHWVRNRCPLVASPVLPVRPKREDRLLFLSARARGVMTTARMRRAVLGRADAIVALSAYEQALIERVFGAHPDRIRIVGNGVDPIDDDQPEVLPDGVQEGEFLLMVGGVSRRKQQPDVARAAGSQVPIVVVGGLVGDLAERAKLERELGESGAVWLGEVRDPASVRSLQRRAGALVLLSAAEAQPLVVLEALGVGTPVVVSDLPAHRELRDRYPGWVTLVRGPDDVLPAWRELAGRARREPPQVPTWSDVAAQLVEVYESVLRRHGNGSRG
jgi:glycosyltransferase involved in cell wall biosynthesis